MIVSLPGQRSARSRTGRNAWPKIGVWVLAIAILGGCASTPEPVIGPTVSEPRLELGQGNYTESLRASYDLRPADVISINVFREPDFSLESVRVGVDGNISIPMIGSIPAAGLTPGQFANDLQRRLGAAGLRNPMVSVNVAEYASHLVTVDGAVIDPGVFVYQPGARLSSAIALADGLSPVAKNEQIAVFRETPGGLQVAKFDWTAINQGTMLDPVLEPGDRIYVGTDGLSVATQTLLTSLPIFAIFTNVLR